MVDTDSFEKLLHRRYSRRAVLRAGTLLGAAGIAATSIPLRTAMAGGDKSAAPFGFTEPKKGYFVNHVLAQGYHADLLLRWGDRMFPDAAEFMPDRQTATAQARQFGYNNDFTAYLPFPHGSRDSTHGLLFVNHEYTIAHLMFAGLTPENEATKVSDEQIAIQMQAHGCSVAEIILHDAGWQTVLGSEFNRRVTATTVCKISGPAAGHARLKTSAENTGMQVRGTIANCSGGVTPWGTVLSAEENFNEYFSDHTDDRVEARNHKRYGVGGKAIHPWYRHSKRFDVKREPREANRFGWVVEIDPYDPQSIPVKRTALGRFKHESATCALSPDGRLVVYSGDDEQFEYIYRFITKEKYNPKNREANRRLLDEGILYVAKFADDGDLEWLPLVHGNGALTDENGFHSQADILIETRRAADMLGATAMDRPEGIAVHPVTGEIFVSLTNNKAREKTDAANPRKYNKYGHVISLTPPRGDHAAEKFRWDLFMLCGNPAGDSQVKYAGGVSACGWFTNPDNLAFDPQGRLWVATDGMPQYKGLSDGLYAVATTGKYRGIPRAFFYVPRGAEMTGPSFTPDGETLFLSVQHPGDDPASSFDHPSTRWPDFDPNMPPRPAVIAITKNGGGKIGS